MLGFHFLVSCFMFLVLSAAAQGEQHQECFDSPVQPCGYLGGITFPFTTSSDPKCGFRIRGCDDDTVDKEISLTDQNWYKIVTIFHSPDLNNLSIIIRYPDFDTPKQLQKPFEIEEKHFKIGNNISFFGCLRNSYDNDVVSSSNMFLYRHCPYHDMYYNSTLRLEYPLPFNPFTCLLFQLPQFGSFCACPSCTFLFSFLEIKFNIPEDCKPCQRPQCEFEFVEGQGLKCYRHDHHAPPPPLSSPSPVSSPATGKAKKIGTVFNFLYLPYIIGKSFFFYLHHLYFTKY